MNNLKAFAMGQANRGKTRMVFDWDKAARLIKENNATTASAGLHSDWEYTGGEILVDGKPDLESYTYLASTWATSELKINGEVFNCFKMEPETPGWDENTKWPQSALDILNGKSLKRKAIKKKIHQKSAKK